MNRRLVILAGVFLLSSMSVGLSADAQVHLHSLSARLSPGTASANALNYTLELTAGSLTETPLSGELAPLPPNAPASHGAFYRLTGDVLFEPVFGTISVNLPSLSDSNTNGVPDFFDLNLPLVSATTTGVFEDPERSGQITATWARDANSRTGTCRLTFSAYNLTFVHTFEVIEFQGRFRYGSTETNVTGFVELSQELATERTLTGALELEKVNADQLRLKPGAWKNEAGLNVAYHGGFELIRSAQQYTNLFFFHDFEPATGSDDFLFWVLRIIDTNDSNNNGIPDLSDQQGVMRLPVLGIERGLTRTNVLLTISGEIGKVHRLEARGSVAEGAWTNVASVTLTNDPQTISVRVTTNRPTFWRVRVP